jgi:hypothetical protein
LSCAGDADGNFSTEKLRPGILRKPECAPGHQKLLFLSSPSTLQKELCLLPPPAGGTEKGQMLAWVIMGWHRGRNAGAVPKD